ncbi:MAG: DUF167 domain-containing protein [Anaerolineaceae bacterium]|nr:DUF167 domain-containing protein [Anaerolineaceae bacterium]
MKKKPSDVKFTNPAQGAALQVHVIANRGQTKIASISKDGTITVELASHTAAGDGNRVLQALFSEVLGVPDATIEIVAGENGDDKLVCFFDLPVDDLNRRLRRVV